MHAIFRAYNKLFNFLSQNCITRALMTLLRTSSNSDLAIGNMSKNPFHSIQLEMMQMQSNSSDFQTNFRFDFFLMVSARFYFLFNIFCIFLQIKIQTHAMDHSSSAHCFMVAWLLDIIIINNVIHTASCFCAKHFQIVCFL